MIIYPGQLDKVFERICKQANTQETPVFIFCSPECDSLCAVGIFTKLLRTEQITYEIHPVQGYADIRSAFTNILQPRIQNEELHTVVMVNCGGMVDIMGMFFGDEDAPDGVNFFIVDSHRPLHLSNVRDSTHVYVLDSSENSKAEYPTPVSDSESEDESEDDDLGFDDSDDMNIDVGSKRKRGGGAKERDPEAYKRRRICRQQTEAYYKYSYYTSHAAGIMYDMADVLNKQDNDMLWLSVMGLTDNYVHDRIKRELYNTHLEKLSDFVIRSNETLTEKQLLYTDSQEGSQEEDNLVSGRPSGHIQFGQEFLFFLMRQWNLYESMYHSRYVATKLGVWKDAGKAQLDLLFAKMGLALREATCPYSNMDHTLRYSLKERFDKYGSYFGLNSDIYYGSFTRFMGGSSIAAADMVNSVTALLEDDRVMEDEEKTEGDDDEEVVMQERRWRASWNKAYDVVCSNSSATKHFKKGLELAITRQKEVVYCGTGVIAKNMVKSFGVLRFVQIDQKNNFTSPRSLSKLALFIMDAYQMSGKKKRIAKPLVLAAVNEAHGTYMVVGVPPKRTQAGGLSYNNFGELFRQACDKVKARFSHDAFDSSVMEIQSDDLKRWLETVVVLLNN